MHFPLFLEGNLININNYNNNDNRIISVKLPQKGSENANNCMLL